jgi:succinate dehydrogenase hydrophobic anchor subunit
MLNVKKVFHYDDDTKELITGTAHQLNGLSYIIDDVKEVLTQSELLILFFTSFISLFFSKKE